MPSSSGWPDRIWVTGTDTGVGKTVVSALLVRRLQAHYWKPIQTGAVEDRDGETVRRLSGCPADRIHPEAVLLPDPCAPNQAARRVGTTIDAEAIRLPAVAGRLVIEGAGGVLVPVTDELLLVDLLVRWTRHVVIVARSGLGTLNHTLLTLEALRRRDFDVLGVVLNGPSHVENRRDLEIIGRVTILAELRPLDPLTPAALDEVCLG